MNKKYYNSILWMSAVLAAMTSCSTEALSEYDRTQANFMGQLNGDISPMQMWRTAVDLNVNVTTNAPVKMWLMSGEDKGTLFDYREVENSSAVKMVAPQGQGNTLYLVCVCNRNKTVQEVSLTGKTEESIYLDFASSSQSAKANSYASAKMTRASSSTSNSSTQSSLYGNSVMGGGEYHLLTDDQKNEALDLLGNYYIEYVNAKTLGLNCDYELESKGDFRITWLAGNCLSSTPHTLGYYYHSPGTYEDIQYVDISETEVYDYIDGIAKIQYMLNDEAASAYGLETNKWYDANFDMGDTFENPSPHLRARKDDDAYGTIPVFKRYGRNISALRGISFLLKVPEGMRVGFYDRVENSDQPDQYDRFIKMGIKPYTSRDQFKTMNFSCEAMNMTMNPDGNHRSCIVESKSAYWLGMENSAEGGDLDCNDVIFEVSADMDIYRPSVIEPDLAPFGEYDDKMPWTIAYEDIYRNTDYDFNDAVIKVVPNYEKETCCVTVMAAGSPSRMYLHYDGPDGDINLGEIHELLGGKESDCINTKTSMAQTSFVQIDCVKWPKSYTMAQDAKRFYIEVKRGTCEDCSDVITLANESGKTPEALLIAGEWKWPKEGVHVMTAYDTFADWSKDITKMAYWNWYSYPKTNTYVNY